MFSTPISYALNLLSRLYPPQKPLTLSGPDSSLKLAELIHASGHKRLLLIADEFLLESGALANVLERLGQGCVVSIFSGVEPNPNLTQVEQALELSLSKRCDSVLAIGGGSVIDVAKVVAAASTNKGGAKN